MVLDPRKADFKASARVAERFADAFVLRSPDFRVGRGEELHGTRDQDFCTLWDIPFRHACKILSGSTFTCRVISSWVMGVSF